MSRLEIPPSYGMPRTRPYGSTTVLPREKILAWQFRLLVAQGGSNHFRNLLQNKRSL
jgi:hypothetical protein